MIGIILLGISMLLIVLDLWMIRHDICDIQKRLDQLESEKLTKSEVDNGNVD